MLVVEILLFRKLAIFGLQTVDQFCFRCVNGGYRIYQRNNPERGVPVTEEDAIAQFFYRGNKRRLKDIMWTVLPSKYRRLFW